MLQIRKHGSRKTTTTRAVCQEIRLSLSISEASPTCGANLGACLQIQINSSEPRSLFNSKHLEVREASAVRLLEDVLSNLLTCCIAATMVKKRASKYVSYILSTDIRLQSIDMSLTAAATRREEAMLSLSAAPTAQGVHPRIKQ